MHDGDPADEGVEASELMPAAPRRPPHLAWSAGVRVPAARTEFDRDKLELFHMPNRQNAFRVKFDPAGVFLALAVDRTHPYVHVGCSPQNQPALLRRKLPGLLVGAHRLAESPLNNPYVRQRDRATKDVGDVPGPVQTCRAIGIRLVGCLEIPVRPGRESHQRSSRSMPEKIVLIEEVESPLGVGHRGGGIAQRHGLSRPVDGDPTR